MSLHVLTAWEILRRQIASDGTVTEATMQDLNGLFQKLLPSALEIIDRGWVHRVCSPCGRTLHVVKGRSESQYVCIGDYCPCRFYLNTVVPGDAMLCKHLLAVHLRDVLQPPLQVKQVSDAEYANYLLSKTETIQSPVKRRIT
eukprot:TRINITY_DN19782_c0_g1_i1.p2 TRINITY_DN19782_c0_g1~~TRINITY_DN19782_c0_g1_i1.p2  ORF type:complete len:143 (+),score=37.19 TRINITY_DN19782_c0_g1_i1:486-914(+)